jgi:hypothetical protein
MIAISLTYGDDMNRDIRSICAILLIVLLCSIPPLSYSQEPIPEMPQVIYSSQPVDVDLLVYKNDITPLVRINTIGLSAGKHYFNSLDGKFLTGNDSSVIGELSGFGELQLDNRIVQNGKLINGSRLQVGTGSCARVELDNHSLINLSSGSDISIAADSDMVYAKVNAGAIKVALPSGISGVIEAANKIVMNMTDREVAFTVRVNGDSVVVEAPEGYTVQNQAVDNSDEYQIAFLSNREERMKPNHSLELQVKITDKQQRPRPGTTVIFSSRDLNGNVSSSFSQSTAVTDTNGIARTNISVGPNNGSVLVSATVPGSSAIATMTIQVKGGLIFGFNTMQAVTLVGAAAAAAVGVQQGISGNNKAEERINAAAAGNEIVVIGRD